MGRINRSYDLEDLYRVYGLLQNVMNTLGYELYADEEEAHILVRKDGDLYLSDIQRVLEWYNMPEETDIVEVRYGNETVLGIRVYCQKPFTYLKKDFDE